MQSGLLKIFRQVLRFESDSFCVVSCVYAPKRADRVTSGGLGSGFAERRWLKWLKWTAGAPRVALN